MATKTVPITGSVLQWAREEAFLTEADLAERLGLPVRDVEEWEAGESYPTRGQFTKLGKVLKRPSAVFFLPTPPIAAGMPTALRRAPGLGGHRLGPEEAQQIRRARRIQKITSWALRDVGEEPVALRRYGVRDDHIGPADEERAGSGVTVADQLAWPSPYQAFRAWRSLLERRGLLVLQLTMGKGKIRGFGVWDDYTPLVAVNTAYDPTARIFTLFHEVAHLLTRTDAACRSFVKPDRHDRDAERWCERFAACFLLPEEGLRKVASDKRYGLTVSSPTSHPQKARLIANRFSVSTRATAIRLQEIGLVNSDLYTTVELQLADRDWNTATGGDGGGRTAVEKRIGQLGSRVVGILLSAADRGRMNTRDLTDYLELKTGEVMDLKKLLPRPG